MSQDRAYKGSCGIWFCLVKGIWSADASQKDKPMMCWLDSSDQLQNHRSCLQLAPGEGLGALGAGALPRHRAATGNDSQQMEAQVFLTVSPLFTVG